MFLLLIYFLVIFTLLREPVIELLKRGSFWLSCFAFIGTWAAIEIYALHDRWWVFSPRKICGIYLATVPLEEYILFGFVHLSTSATWLTLKRFYDVD